MAKTGKTINFSEFQVIYRLKPVNFYHRKKLLQLNYREFSKLQFLYANLFHITHAL